MAVNKRRRRDNRKASLLFSPAIQYTMVKNNVGMKITSGNSLKSLAK